ncbi:MAG: histidine kinase [Chitinophagaceae bacterium]|nr:histidine kinase [Chitinophagaceae bacterium]
MRKNRQRKKFTFYIIIGAIFLFLRLLDDGVTNPGTFWERCVNNTWLTFYLIVNNYVLFEYTVPFFIRSWKTALTSPVLLFIHFLFYSLGIYAWRAIGISLHTYYSLTTDSSIEEGVTRQLPYSLGSIIFFLIARYIFDYFRLRQVTQQLTIEKQQAELGYLKSQTNPHFLFNTLNNIYALTLEKSDRAPESVLRLSKILRFMLYETTGNYIAVENEIKIINDYVELEKLRYDEGLNVNFNYDVEDMKQSIPPLLLIPLVENAFKHGVSETRSAPFIAIHLSIKKRQLIFGVKNSVNTLGGETKVNENIGLTNLRRQLELLYSDYKLSLSQEKSMFTATLNINLASHV